MIRNPALREWYRGVRNKRRNQIAKIMGVEYAHLHLKNKDDLYVTAEGMPFLENLTPENFWTDREWFQANATRLSGTSSVYRIRTKVVNGRSRTIVVKWNRMGQDIPGEGTQDGLTRAEFNSPFEEFALVSELRGEVYKRRSPWVIQKHLAIYVPSEREDSWQDTRREHKMQAKIESHSEVALDMLRSYAVIYEWIGGIDAAEACRENHIDRDFMVRLTLDAEKKLKRMGFLVRDNKPEHVIVRPKGSKGLARDRQGTTLCALVDFELLERSPRKERRVRKIRRAEYHTRQRDRFIVGTKARFHPHLHHVRTRNVDYIYGTVPSTNGRLWVVGKDPYLFDFFLPERWEHAPKTKISPYGEMYHTVTKDNIHLVWKVSKVGVRPDMDPFKIDEERILEHGYNSPFEEVALAIDLPGKNVPCIYPRAIYMSGRDSSISANLFDNSRYQMHGGEKTPDGLPVLRRHREYITIWGYWNGPDEQLAAKDGDFYEGIDALRAYREGRVTQQEYFAILSSASSMLLGAGVEDLNLHGNHILISYDSSGNIIRDTRGEIAIRICNFEFFKNIQPPSRPEHSR